MSGAEETKKDKLNIDIDGGEGDEGTIVQK